LFQLSHVRVFFSAKRLDRHIMYVVDCCLRNILCFVAVKRDVQAGDEVGIRVKEQSIIELGKLFAKTRQAQGKASAF